MKKTLIAAAILLPITANASLYDSRSAGMGGVGAASADYLTASFHNPALAAAYGENDDFGLLLPTIGLAGQDGDDAYDKIDAFQDINENIADNPDQADAWKKALSDLDGVNVNIRANIGGVVAIPNKHVSANLFTKAEAITIAGVELDKDDLDITDPVNQPINSTVHAVGGGTAEAGITLAKELTVADKFPILVGISPKFQQLYVINYTNTVDGFDEDDFDFDNDRKSKSAFNIDAGVSYNLNDNVRFGFYGQNLISQEIESKTSHNTKATYLVEPAFVVGAAYNAHLYSFALDVDLNERKYFKEKDFATQSVRIGGELNAWDWAQLRAGYMHSLTDHQEDVVTAGIGLKPFGVFGLDVAGQYGKDNNYGASVQMIYQF